MIKFPVSVTDVLSGEHYEMFYLVRVGEYRTTNYFHTLVIDEGLPGEQTFTHDGRVISVDPPQMSTSVDREIYRIMLADPSYMLTSVFGNIVGKPVEVYMGVVDGGAPTVSSSELVMLYKGWADNFAYEIDTEEVGEVRAIVSCSSPMADLDAINQLFTSKYEIRNIDPQDTSFEQVYEGSGNAEFMWGKKTG